MGRRQETADIFQQTGKIRQQLFQCGPFSRSCQPPFRTKHMAVFFKKYIVVVFVLFHNIIQSFLPAAAAP